MTKLILILLSFFLTLHATQIDINAPKTNILQDVEIAIVSEKLSFSEIKKLDDFQTYDKHDINLGFQRSKKLCVKFCLYNDTNKTVNKVLEIQNPLLEEVILYEGKKVRKSGMLHILPLQTSIDPSFEISLAPYTKQEYYLEIHNHTTALRFALFLKEKKGFAYEEHQQLTIIMLALGIIFSLFLYNLFLYIYSKEKVYLYYGIYLAVLVFQQLTYLGITPLYFSKEFVEIDNLSVVLKVNGMYIAATLFAQAFLNTKKYPQIHKIYNFIIIAAIAEIPLFGTPWFYYPEIGILTGLGFVIFNIFAALYIYMQGNKEARFFIAGWSVLVVAFVLMIIDGLGIISVMYQFPNLILFATVLEALLLSLAFSDRYVLLREQKERSDRLLVASLENRQMVIEAEIKKQTQDLSNALENQKILLKEVHHRTKNNLQLILSIIRMQSQGLEHSLQERFLDLENRIAAIATTHELLYLQKNLQLIDMFEYVNELCTNIAESFQHDSIEFEIDVGKLMFPFREAGYVGLLINEIVINSIKHAQTEFLKVSISMKQESNNYTIMISDNGESEVNIEKKEFSLGSALIKTLVVEQLEGEYEVNTDQGVRYVIRFSV